MGEVKIAAPMILMWFFQQSHQPCIQYSVDLEFLHLLFETRSMEEIDKVLQFLS